jgi:glucose 1-dehydrogenase
LYIFFNAITTKIHLIKYIMRFQNKVCLVTGGGSGIGKATCKQLASEGGLLVVIDYNEKAGNDTVTEITKINGQAMFVKADIGNPIEIENAVQAAVLKWNKIDVLVNNAAIMTFKPILELSVEEWDKVMGVNLRSVFLFCKFCLPYMTNGAIVNVSSVHAHQTTVNVIPYATSKGGIEAFTRGMSREYPLAKTRINCIAPGAVDTPMLWNNPNMKNEDIDGLIGTPEEIADAICFLASDESAYINGTTLVVDGGRLDKL